MSHPLAPVCVPCARQYRCEKNSVYFVQAAPAVGVEHPAPGTIAPEDWRPYKLWVGDKYRCYGCGHEILTGYGQNPVAEHYEPDFPDLVARCGATLQVNGR